MMQSVLLERLLFAIGITLLSGSVLQYRAATAGTRGNTHDEPHTLPGAPLAQLRPLAVSIIHSRSLIMNAKADCGPVV